MELPLATSPEVDVAPKAWLVPNPVVLHAFPSSCPELGEGLNPDPSKASLFTPLTVASKSIVKFVLVEVILSCARAEL